MCANTRRRVRQPGDRLLSCWYPAELVTMILDRSCIILSDFSLAFHRRVLASRCYYPALPESNFLRRFLQSLLRPPLARRTTFKGSLKLYETCVALERKMSISKVPWSKWKGWIINVIKSYITSKYEWLWIYVLCVKRRQLLLNRAIIVYQKLIYFYAESINAGDLERYVVANILESSLVTEVTRVSW